MGPSDRKKKYFFEKSNGGTAGRDNGTSQASGGGDFAIVDLPLSI